MNKHHRRVPAHLRTRAYYRELYENTYADSSFETEEEFYEYMKGVDEREDERRKKPVPLDKQKPLDFPIPDGIL